MLLVFFVSIYVTRYQDLSSRTLLQVFSCPLYDYIFNLVVKVGISITLVDPQVSHVTVCAIPWVPTEFVQILLYKVGSL